MLTLEYSRKQKCYHISELKYICTLNRNTIITKSEVDYLLIGAYDTYEELDADMQQLKKSGFPGGVRKLCDVKPSENEELS